MKIIIIAEGNDLYEVKGKYVPHEVVVGTKHYLGQIRGQGKTPEGNSQIAHHIGDCVSEFLNIDEGENVRGWIISMKSGFRMLQEALRIEEEQHAETKAKLDNYINEDRIIRVEIKADENESTFDEVVRLVNRYNHLKKKKDEPIETVKRMSNSHQVVNGRSEQLCPNCKSRLKKIKDKMACFNCMTHNA